MSQVLTPAKSDQQVQANPAPSSDVMLDVRDLCMYFQTFDGVIKAVDGISFSLKEKEILGIVGESGSGKSAASYSILKLLDGNGKIESGQIIFEGRDLVPASEKEMQKIRGDKISMVFQDSLTSLDPLKTIEHQLSEMFILHRPEMSKAERRAKCIELLKAVGIPKPEERLKSYPFQLSGGMRQRVVIAIALSIEPKLLIADEPTTALDVTIQAQILRLMTKLVKEQGTSLILITHDLAVVSENADRIAVMYCGKLVEHASRDELIHQARHPYTVGLLKCIPRLRSTRPRLPHIPGMVPSMLNLPQGCYFADRCPRCQDKCRKVQPQLTEHTPDHFVACHYPLAAGEDVF